MKNNIIKDDREISMKAESFPTDISDDAQSTETVGVDVDPTLIEAAPLEHHNLLTETSEMNTNTLADMPDPTEPMKIDDESKADEPIADPAVAGQSTQTELTAFFERAKSTATEFFNSNRQLFITLGWTVLAIIGAKFVFAALGTIDDIPLVTPILKIVGLVSVVRFSWRYLIREHDRQELLEIIDRTKAEVLGDRKSLS
jgi:hypothetical protein